jgi:hypothetical protein
VCCRTLYRRSTPKTTVKRRTYDQTHGRTAQKAGKQIQELEESSSSARRKELTLGLIAELTRLVTKKRKRIPIAYVKDLPMNDSLNYFLFLYSLEPRDIVPDHASRPPALWITSPEPQIGGPATLKG